MLRYAVPVYTLEFLKNNGPNNIHLFIDDNLFLETLLIRLREETIKFASLLKKTKMNREERLKEEINDLEKSNNIFAVINLLQDKKDELETLRENKMKGQIVRSRVQWLQHGEKPSKYFCSLENKQFTEKTIKCIKKENGTIINEQAKILNEIKIFYQSLFHSYDQKLENINLNEYLRNYHVNKLTSEQSKTLEGEITISELGHALKYMKNEKTPGIDGFSSGIFQNILAQTKIFYSKFH